MGGFQVFYANLGDRTRVGFTGCMIANFFLDDLGAFLIHFLADFGAFLITFLALLLVKRGIEFDLTFAGGLDAASFIASI